MKKVLKYIKNFIIVIITMLAFLVVVGDPEEITIKIVALKFLSLAWLWIVAKANYYFYEGE